ncbi:MAG: HEAT repeat domain-containing protein, partial [Cyanobacteria bacterium J06639_1]
KLSDCLDDLDIHVAEKAAFALSRSPLPRAAELLGLHLTKTLVPVRLQCAIARALVWMATPVALRHLRQAMSQLDPAARQEAIAALGRLEAIELRPVAVEMLFALLDEGDVSASARAAIAHSLGQLQDLRALPVLETLARDADERVQWHAIAAIERLTAAGDR